MFSVLKVKGSSIAPDIEDGSYLITKSFTLKNKKKQFLVFKHQVYGMLLKMLVRIDKYNNHWFRGNNSSSISENQIGPISKDAILGQVIFCIHKKGIKFFY